MTDNSVAGDLLNQAKKHLTSGEFEAAAKMARAVLALDESNEEANNILKAASAASGVSTNVDESQIKAELNSIAIEVQTALNSEDFPEAERLIRQYMEKHSGIPGSEKILKDVQVARRKFNENKIWEQENLVQAEKAAKQVESASRRKKLQVVALVVAVVAVVVVVKMLTGNAPPLDQMEQVNIDDMIQLKKGNSSAADAYKGRWVTANGLVKTEYRGKVTVLGLKSSDGALGTLTAFSGFECHVGSDQKEIAKNLAADELVKIGGKLDGWTSFLSAQTAIIKPCDLYYP